VTERRRGWPENQRYLKFVLYKENKETMDALAILSSLLRYFSMCVCVENM
jgi:tRNA(Glu) U13 pseudouridine synthase TruD